MIGQSFAEEMDCGNFFDQIDDFIDFPSDDICAGFGTNDCNLLPSIWCPEPESLPGSLPAFSSKNNSDKSTELYVPYEEIVQLNWLPSFVDDSLSRESQSLSLTADKKEDISPNTGSFSSSHSYQFQTSSPVSVLESSSSNTYQTGGQKRGRPRTKRPRPESISLAENEENKEKEENIHRDLAESRLVIRIPKYVLSEHKNKKNKKKKKRAKISAPVVDNLVGNQNQESSSSSSSSLPPPSSQQLVRKCLHCEITKTPQWRLGPMGPKTLCNACGVRYKSGRLFPEYRPAASPTFAPSLHSNSHKKVIEMRSKKCDMGLVDNPETEMSDLPELIPNRSSIIMDYP